MSLAWQHRDRRLCASAEGARPHAQRDRQTEQIAAIKPSSQPATHFALWGPSLGGGCQPVEIAHSVCSFRLMRVPYLLLLLFAMRDTVCANSPFIIQ